MDASTNSKLITSFLPKGTGLDLVKALKDETGISTGNVSNSRGTGSSAGNDFGEWVEVDVFDVIVESDRAEEIFNFIYNKAGIDDGNNGFIIQSNLAKATKFTLPDLPKES
ncbi:MAG: hypothetical protein HOB26_03465 [Flavobacteriales bacterium]|nr:hypothetical protein [Flavobacteriales bacterium]